MKFIIFLCVFHLTRAEENVEGIAESGELPEQSSLPTLRDFVETKNLKLFLNLMRRMNLVGLHEIPPFDPFTKDIERVDINGLPNVTGWVSLSNLTVTGIDKFDFPELLLQSESLKDPEQKLLTFVQTLPRLDFEAEVIGQYTMDNMKVDVDLQMAGYSTGITNTGQLGLSKLYMAGQNYGGSLYQIDSHKIKTHMNTLQIEVINTRSSKSTITEGDVIAAVVSDIVTSELNKILWGVTSDQVDAFLRTGKPDKIEIDLINIDGKSKSGELAEPEDEINVWESNNLAMVVELTRRLAAVGMHSVPIFSPYKAQIEPVTLDPSVVGSAVITLSDVVVKGLDSFENEVLTLQPANTTRGYSKLLKLKQNFASLSATANVVVRLGDEDTSASVSAVATNVVNSGTMEIDLVDVPNDEQTFGDLAYQITAFDLENRIQNLKLKLTNIQNENSNIGPWNRDLVQKLADGLSLAVGKAAKNQLNAILRSYKSLQVDAFLDA